MSTSEQWTHKGLSMWVVYDHPTDVPGHFVARMWEGLRPTGSFVQSEDLDIVRQHMLEMGLTAIARSREDDPVILEIWL